MEEKNRKLIKYLNFLSGLFLIVFVVGFVGFTINPMKPPPVCFKISINFFIFFFLVTSLILQISVIIFYIKNNLPLKNHVNEIVKFLLVIFIFFILGFLTNGGGARVKSRDAKRQADLRVMREAQELFYSDNSRFAVSQQELINAGYFPSYAVIDPLTKKEYADKDGAGLDGGDDDPGTWEIQAFLETYPKEICSKNKPVYTYICNQKGCEKEIYFEFEK